MVSVELVLFLSSLLAYTMAQDICGPTIPCINGLCTPQVTGEMACTCNPGFIPDLTNPLVCNPVGGPGLATCSPLPGIPGQQCINGVCQPQGQGLYRCLCFQGYLPGLNPNICEDFDECFSFTGCAPGACVNLPGNYYCTSCMPGYTLNQLTNRCESFSNSQNIHPWLWWWLLD